MKYWFYSYQFKVDNGIGFGNAYLCSKLSYFNVKQAREFQLKENREIVVLFFTQIPKKQYEQNLS